jgi:hypothetical protein
MCEYVNELVIREIRNNASRFCTDGELGSKLPKERSNVTGCWNPNASVSSGMFAVKFIGSFWTKTEKKNSTYIAACRL